MALIVYVLVWCEVMFIVCGLLSVERCFMFVVCWLWWVVVVV